MPAASCQGEKSMGGARALALLLKRFREKTRCFVDEPLPRLGHVVSAEHGLGVVAVHYIAEPDLDAAISKGLAAAIDFAGVEGGDGIIEGHFSLA
jgi:hypothetical protein